MKYMKKNKNTLLSVDAIFAFNSEFKKYKEKNNVKVNHKVISNVNNNDLKGLIKFAKQNDKNWYLTTLTLLLLNEGNSALLKEQKIINLSKFISLLSSQNEIDSLSNNQNELLKNIIIEQAYQVDEKLGKSIQNIFSKSSNTKLSTSFESILEKNYENIVKVISQIYNVYFEFLKENCKTLNINWSTLANNVVEYYVIKIASQKYLDKNEKRQTFIVESNYNKFSERQLLILDEVQKNLKFIKNNLSEQFIFEMSELETKVNYSDLPPMTWRDWFGLGIKYAILLFWALVILYPIFILIQQGFNDNNSRVIINIQDFKFSLNSYRTLFQQTLYLRWLFNSTMIGLANMIFTLFIVSLTAYSFSRFKYKGKNAFLIALLVSQMIPSFTAVIVYFIITELLNISLQIPPIVTLIFIYAGGGIASNTVILKGYMDSISQDIDDAARIDGCSHFWIYSRIILPLCKPMLVLIALMSFIGPFGDVILPQLILRNQRDYTVAVGLNMFINSERLKNYGGYFAGATLVSVPIVILFIGLQKYVVAGLTTGGVKG